MTKLQIGLLLGAALFFSAMYWGLDNRPPNHEQKAKSRSLVAQSTDIRVLLKEARASIGDNGADVFFLEQQVQDATVDSIKIGWLKKLSGKWYELRHPEIAGHYASQVAELVNEAEAWAITGTTYALCIQQTKEQKVRDFCTSKAVEAFESAISLDPNEISHRINLAMCYTKNPPSDNPMKGVLMLVDLNKRYPDNASILTKLGELAIQTGQFEKAKERLERALEIQPSPTVHCLLIQVYRQLGDKQKEAFHQEACSG